MCLWYFSEWLRQSRPLGSGLVTELSLLGWQHTMHQVLYWKLDRKRKEMRGVVLFTTTSIHLVSCDDCIYVVSEHS